MYLSEACDFCITMICKGGYLRRFTNRFWRETRGIGPTFFYKKFLRNHDIAKYRKNSKNKDVFIKKLAPFV